MAATEVPFAALRAARRPFFCLPPVPQMPSQGFQDNHPKNLWCSSMSCFMLRTQSSTPNPQIFLPTHTSPTKTRPSPRPYTGPYHFHFSDSRGGQGFAAGRRSCWAGAFGRTAPLRTGRRERRPTDLRTWAAQVRSPVLGPGVGRDGFQNTDHVDHHGVVRRGSESR